MANWWDKNLTDKQKFRLQEPQDASLLDVVSAVPNPVGDVASGLLAAQNVSEGNYGMAALNALGLLPFVPSMGAITAWHGSPLTNLTELNPKKSFGNLGVSWVSPNKEFASGYNYVGKNGKVYEIDLNEGKSFNFNNAEDLSLLKEKAKDIPYYDRLRGMTTLDKRIPDSSSYYSAEDPDIFNLIKKLGYDTVKVTENGIENIGVFNPKKNAKIIK